MSDDGGITQAAEAYARFFEELSPDTIDRLDSLVSETVRFRDPFNAIEGRTNFKQLFRDMFDDVDEPRFEITDGAMSTRTAYLRWTFTFRMRGKKRSWHIDGMSEIHFDDNGLVEAHLDHWDAASQFYEKLPVIGFLYRTIRRVIMG